MPEYPAYEPVIATGDALLAVTSYDPAGATSVTTTSSTASRANSANLAVTFTVPASGIVDVELEAVGRISNAAGNMAWCLMSDASTVVSAYRFVTNSTGTFRQRATFRVTGLTPAASLTWYWGFLSADNTQTASIFFGGGTGGGGYGAASMRVFRRAL